jgi:hypothetical protein
VNVGLFRSFTGAEIRALAEGAGLEVLYLDDEDDWYAVLRNSTMRPAGVAQVSGAGEPK